MEKAYWPDYVFETVTIAMISLTGGIGGGFLLSKGVYLLLLRMVRAEVQWGFHFSGECGGGYCYFLWLSLPGNIGRKYG